jgi:hypothetical protein
MAATYNSSLSTTTDQIRFLIQDTDVSNYPFFQDEEIAWAYTEEGNIYFAGALLCGRLSAHFAQKADKKSIDGFDVTYTKQSEHYAQLQKELQAKGENGKNVSLGSLSAFAGGISISDKEVREADTDRVQSSFSMKMDDNNSCDYDDNCEC